MGNYDLTIYRYLKKNLKVCRKTTSEDETIIRCPFCKDSQRDLLSGHFYINNKAPFKFYCQKCNVSGLFSAEVLNMLQLYDSEINGVLSSSYIAYVKQLNYKYGDSYNNYFNMNKINFRVSKLGITEYNKINYIENRTGIKLSNSDLFKYKIILNLDEFLSNNKIDKEKILTNDYTRNKFDILNKYTVGFLTFDKNMIICRSIDENKTGFRYFNFKIFNSEINFSKKFFTINNDINLNSKSYDIIMTEGIFDIMGVYNHVYNKVMLDNTIFIANNGKGYNFILNYIPRIGMLNTNIYIYSDKDVDVEYYKKLKRYNRLCKYNDVKVFYNKIGKDYGVCKDQIELSDPIII